MSARNRAVLGHLSLCGGSFSLGVATALVLVRFGEFSANWQFGIAVAVAVTAVVLVSAGFVALVRESAADDPGHRPGHASAVTMEVTADQTVLQATGPGTAGDALPATPAAQSVSSETGTEVAGDESSSDSDVATPPVGEPEPDTVAELRPADLIDAWNNYRRTGNGFFNTHGLQRVLDERGGEATVSRGDRIHGGGNVLVVEMPSRKGHFFVLPNFAKSPRAVEDWFDDNSDGALTGRTEQVIQVAEGRWTDSGFEKVKRGAVA